MFWIMLSLMTGSFLIGVVATGLFYSSRVTKMQEQHKITVLRLLKMGGLKRD